MGAIRKTKQQISKIQIHIKHRKRSQTNENFQHFKNNFETDIFTKKKKSNTKKVPNKSKQIKSQKQKQKHSIYD